MKLHQNAFGGFCVVMKDRSESHNNILIVGGGPAGLATAISLTQRGLESTILETNGIKYEKLGETLSPSILPLLKVLGADHLLNDPEHLPCYGNYFNWGMDVMQEKYFMPTTTGHGWHLQRSHFENELMKVTQHQGVTISRCRVLEAMQDRLTGNWKLLTVRNGEKQTVYPRFVVDATGRSAKIARNAGAKRISYDALTGIAGRFKIDNSIALPYYTHIQAVETGWWYAAVLSNNIVVTVYMTDADLIDKKNQQLAGYWEILGQASIIRSLFPKEYTPERISLCTQPAITSHLTKICGNNWLAVGDAAYTFDPISSYGIASALGSGFYAGNAIADYLSGAKEALMAYQYLAEKAFATYLSLWKNQYADEIRWPKSPFWTRRNRETKS